MKQPDTSSQDPKASSQAIRPQSNQVRHLQRGAIPSPRADVEKAPIFVPDQGAEAQEQASSAPESAAPKG